MSHQNCLGKIKVLWGLGLWVMGIPCKSRSFKDSLNNGSANRLIKRRLFYIMVNSTIRTTHSNDSHQCPILVADFVIFLLWDRKWTSHPGRGGKRVRDRDRLSIFYPITNQLRVWDTDVNHYCGTTYQIKCENVVSFFSPYI